MNCLGMMTYVRKAMLSDELPCDVPTKQCFGRSPGEIWSRTSLEMNLIDD